jgi:tetratricopeptide (TPR) repeat protein
MALIHSATVERDLREGLAHHQAGRLDTAEAFYRKALKKAPEHPDALNLLGVIAQDRGRPVRAVQLISQALRAKPRFPEALANLARAQRATGDLGGALDSARRAVSLNPALPEGQIQLARVLIDLADYTEAVTVGRTAVARAPRSLDARVNLGVALSKLKQWEEAAQVYQQAHALAPAHAGTLTDFAVALREMQLFADALRAHERAVALAPGDARVHTCHAVTLKRAQNAAGAAEVCRKAIALEPENADVWVMLGHNLAALGRFADAAEAHRKAITLDPESAEARRGLVTAGLLLDDHVELGRLRVIADDTAQPRGERIAAGFALGRLFDKADECDLAFERYAAANRLLRQAQREDKGGFDATALERQVDGIIATWTAEAIRAAQDHGDPSELPVFIVGMPRSGTTLTEQIAASHARVFGAGELHDVGRIVRTLARPSPGGGLVPWDPPAARREASSHMDHLRTLGGAAERVTDKMPDNVFSLGAIAALFPHARIVLCRRDLRDTCLSCYFQRFTSGLDWTSDLADLALRARQVERVIDHWRKVLPIPILELRYESLVSDLEAEGRRLISFLGLEWDPACLSFHETERQVLTASVWQVRQPLYSSSIGRWRQYRRHLGPLLEGLAGIVPLNDD